ncbi:MAG: septum formation protein [Myxococcota bacterium]|jgi:septum formation protein
MDLVLASTSHTRRTLLRQSGIRHRAFSPDVDESAIRSPDPAQEALLRAGEKARQVALREPHAVVIGADQVAYDPDRPEVHWGKPGGNAEAIHRLRGSRGRTHALVTGLVVIAKGRETSSTVTTHLTVRSDLTDAEIDAYVATGEGAGCAGAYAAEGRGVFLFDSIDGDWTNVLGLPIPELLTHLRRLGWRANLDWA